MKDLILRLMEIEEKAQTITADERQRLENLDAELKEAEEKKSSEIEKRADSRVGKMRTQAEAEVRKKLDELNRRNAQETRAVRERFEKNRGRWSKRIYEEIIAD